MMLFAGYGLVSILSDLATLWLLCLMEEFLYDGEHRTGISEIIAIPSKKK